MAPQSVLR